MSPEERIEEAHGLWELAVTRVAAIAEVLSATPRDMVVVPVDLLASAVKLEREAFACWQDVSREAIGAP